MPYWIYERGKNSAFLSVVTPLKATCTCGCSVFEWMVAYVAELITHGYAPKSIDHYHDVLSTILTKAVQWGYIQNNPAHGVELPRVAPVCEKWIFTPAQAQELLSRLTLLPRTIIGLALLTGARRGELFALRWRSFDREKQALLIQEAIYDGIIDKPKTQKSIRRIPLSNAAIGLLESWSKGVEIKSPDSFIFPKRNGAPKDPKQIMRDHVFPASEALGLRRPGWLTFRRTFATWADQNGVGAKQRGDLMGNSAEINAEVYTQVTDTGLRRAVECVGEQLFAPAKSKLFTDCSLFTEWVN